jgi:hypothetical protein
MNAVLKAVEKSSASPIYIYSPIGERYCDSLMKREMRSEEAKNSLANRDKSHHVNGIRTFLVFYEERLDKLTCASCMESYAPFPTRHSAKTDQ